MSGDSLWVAEWESIYVLFGASCFNVKTFNFYQLIHFPLSRKQKAAKFDLRLL